MTPQEKAKELSNKYERIVEYSVEQCLIEMHEWTKNELLFILDNSYELRKKISRSELSFADCTELVKRIKKIVEDEL